MKIQNDTSPAWQAQYDALVNAGTSIATRHAYQRDTHYFTQWATLALDWNGVLPVDDETIIIFILQHLQGMPENIEHELVTRGIKKPGTLRVRTAKRYLSSVSIMHQEAGFPSPTTSHRVKLLLKRAQRGLGNPPTKRKAAITIDILQQLLNACDDSLRGLRDRAILAVGVASGGRRRSEIAAITINDIKRTENGYLVRINKSKTDQEGKGHVVPVLGEAGTALSAWLLACGLREGILFRGILPGGKLTDGIDGRTINRIVKRRIKQIGLDPREFGAHSLRAGFMTQAARSGISLQEAMAMSYHSTVDVAMQYYHAANVLDNPAANLLSNTPPVLKTKPS